MTTTCQLATIDDIRAIAAKIENRWTAERLFAHTRRASEAETMVWQTVHACLQNFQDVQDAFSWRGDGVFDFRNGGIVDNRTAYGMLLNEGYFIEDQRDGKTIIRMTQKLVDMLNTFLDKSAA